jgi:hypothetical protein
LKATITREQHDALDGQLTDRLDGLGDIEIDFKEGRLRNAERRARECAEELHVLAGLRKMAEQSALQAEPGVLRRVMERMRAIAVGDTAGLAPQMADLRKDTEKNRLVAEACTSVLLAVAETPAESEDDASTGMRMSEETVWPRGA